LKIAITGGMGCGKSTVLNVLSELLPHYKFGSYDAEVKRLYAHDAVFKSTLRLAFGTDVKSEIAKMVFSDPEKMQFLFNLTERPLRAFMEKVTSNLNCVLEAPMLFQIPGAPQLFDKVIAVWCDRETQRARIKARDGLPEEMIDRKLAVQFSPDEIALRSDFVIDTSDGAVDVAEQLSVALRVAELKSV
jgi:dephospho-CoA kinase